MDSDTVFIPHLVELIDADDAAVRKDHGTSFKVELPGGVVSLDGSRETCCGGAFARGVDCNRGDFLDEFEELRLCCSGVAKEEDVDVSS